MVVPREQPASRLRSQAILIYVAGLGVGTQLGLMHAYMLRSWRSVIVFIVGSVVFSTTTLLLWQRVFPRLLALPLSRGRRRSLQIAIALVAMTVTSFLVVEVDRWVSAGKSIFELYDGGDIPVTIPAHLIRIAPFVYFLVPILPTTFMAVVGFNQSWWQMFLLEARAHQARELAASAQLEALRSRINPHFLFNSLNSIAQLISTDPDRAEACVERLAEIFRYLLHSDSRQFATLGDELEIADAYLDIERARYGDRLRVDVVVDPAIRQHVVPTLILQPLVENAVKHGVSPKVGGGSVRIEAAAENGDLRLVVRDTGVGMVNGAAAALSNGVGLRNVYDRLVQLYGEDYAPEIHTVPGQGTSITLRVPQATVAPPDRSLH